MYLPAVDSSRSETLDLSMMMMMKPELEQTKPEVYKQGCSPKMPRMSIFGLDTFVVVTNAVLTMIKHNENTITICAGTKTITVTIEKVKFRVTGNNFRNQSFENRFLSILSTFRNISIIRQILNF